MSDHFEVIPKIQAKRGRPAKDPLTGRLSDLDGKTFILKFKVTYFNGIQEKTVGYFDTESDAIRAAAKRMNRGKIQSMEKEDQQVRSLLGHSCPTCSQFVKDSSGEKYSEDYCEWKKVKVPY